MIYCKLKSSRNFEGRLFLIKNLNKIPTREPSPELATEPTPEVTTKPTKDWKFKLKLQQEFINETIAD